MFGLKIMKKSNYNSLTNALEETTAKLNTKTMDFNKIKAEHDCLTVLLQEANKINNSKANENGCMIGEWCKQCRYGKKMRIDKGYFDPTRSRFSHYQYVDIDLGYYCAKHMKDICPEFEMTEK